MKALPFSATGDLKTLRFVAVPPHRAGINGIALGLGHRRQDFLEPAEQRLGEVLAAQVGQQQGGGKNN